MDTPEQIREARDTFYKMDDEHWKELAVYADDKTISDTKWGMRATVAGEFFGNDWLNRLIWC
jgi:hypothetical protein